MSSIDLKQDFSNVNVGDIVASKFSTSRIFRKYGIDYCCHGNIELSAACKNAGVDLNSVMTELREEDKKQYDSNDNNDIPFAEWPLDLLIDYVLKIHHRGIRKNGPELLGLIGKTRNAHQASHPELNELYNMVEESLLDLESHLQKEENVLFPYLADLFEAAESNNLLEPMHCGTIANPIRVMNREHENEGNRYLHIKELTNNFSAPADACNTYKSMLIELEKFITALFEHIHIENNILFPKFIELERKVVKF